MAVSERCKTHPDEFYTFYCAAHDMVYCPVCTEESHGECVGVSFLQDAPEVSNTEKSDLCNRLNEIVAQIEEKRDPIETELAKILEQKAKIVTDLCSFRDEVIEKLEIEIRKGRIAIQNAFQSVEDLFNEDLEKLSIILTAVDCAKGKSNIGADKTHEQDVVDAKLGRHRLNAVQDMVDNLKLSKEVRVAPNLHINKDIIELEEDSVIQNSVKNGMKKRKSKKSMRSVQSAGLTRNTCIGNLHNIVAARDSGLGDCEMEVNSEDESGQRATSNESKTGTLPFTVQHLLHETLEEESILNGGHDEENVTSSPVSVKKETPKARRIHNLTGNLQVSFKTKDSVAINSDKDFNSSDITGMCALPDNSFLLCDHNNKYIRQMDERKVVKTSKLWINPFDVCVISENEVAISSPNNSRILTASINALTVSDSFRTDKPIKGIDSDREHIYGASSTHTGQASGAIYVFTKDGATVRIIDLQKLSPHLLMPVRLCLDRNGLPLFTDPKRGLFRLETDSNVTHLVNYGDISGVCVTNDVSTREIILICQTQSNIIRAINKSGRVLSTLEFLEADWHVSLAFAKNTSTLAVGCLNSNTVPLVELKYNITTKRESLII